MKRPRAVPGVIALGLLTFAVLYGPGWAIEHAQKSHTACSNRDYEDRPQVDETCDSSGWLSFPKLVPWKRKAALEREISIQRNVASRALKLSSSFRPDAAARAKAADAAAEVYRKEREDPTAPAAEGLLSLFALEGDADAIRRHKGVARTGLAAQNVLRALFSAGHLDAAIELARSLPKLDQEDYAARELYFTRGVLLCMDKDPVAGAAALGEAERVNAQFHTFPYHEARIAKVACGQSLEPKSDDLDRDPILSFALEKRLTGKTLDDRLIGPARLNEMIRPESTSPFVVAALLSRERTLDETIQLLSVIPRVPWLGMAPLPWSSRIASSSLLASYPLLLDPDRHERAAALLEKLSSSAPAEGPKPAEIEKVASRLPAQLEARYTALSENPRSVLRHYARGFFLEAASAWASQGNRERAERAAKRAHELSPTTETAVLAAPSLISLGSFAAAGKLLAESDRTEASVATRALSLALEAQIFIHFRRWKEARLAAESGLVLTKKLGSSDFDAPLASAIRWLVLAVAIKTGDTGSAPAIATPEIYERDPRSWSELLALAEPERATLRWRMRTVEIPSLSITLPAQMFVIGEAARGFDVDVWLDHELGLFDRRLWGAPALRARAEAARFRGDDKAEADYLARAAKLESRLGDPRLRALGSLIGL